MLAQSSVFPSVVFVHILLGTALTLAGVLVAAALLYWHWIEVVLLCRTYKNKDETLRGKITQHATLCLSHMTVVVLLPTYWLSFLRAVLGMISCGSCQPEQSMREQSTREVRGT